MVTNLVMVTVLVKITTVVMITVLLTIPRMVTVIVIGVVSGHRIRGCVEGVMGTRSGFIGS